MNAVWHGSCLKDNSDKSRSEIGPLEDFSVFRFWKVEGKMKKDESPVIPVYVKDKSGKFEMLISQDEFDRCCSNGYVSAIATGDMFNKNEVPEGSTKVLILRSRVRPTAPAADWTDVLPEEKDVA